MIPENRDDLHALAGEYVLGVLEPDEAREIEAALPGNAELRRAVAFWEEKLHPLAALAPAAEPPANLWSNIEARIVETPQTGAKGWWSKPAPWRWATAGFAAAAAALLLYVALGGSPAAPSYVAMLHAPQATEASWLVTVSHGDMTVRTVAAASPPQGRAFELWAIAPGSTTPQAVGIIPASGIMRTNAPPPEVKLGATLAISVEPTTGSPDQNKPSGPVVFVGAVESL
jgi:anti-sigma-K factor RskA